MGSFVNFTDVDLVGGAYRSPGASSLNSVGQRENDQREFNSSAEVSQRFQPLNEVGGELIERFTSINRLQGEIDVRQQANEKLGTLQELLQDPNEENLAAAEDLLKDLGQLVYTDENGQNQRVISEEDTARIRFDIPGETLDKLKDIIEENTTELEKTETGVRREEEDLQRFIENQGVQTGQAFTSRAEVVTSFLNVELTGQLLDVFS